MCCKAEKRKGDEEDIKYEGGSNDNKGSVLSSVELQRFYERGLVKLSKNLRLEVLLKRLKDLHIYHRDLKRVGIHKMERVRYNSSNVINVISDADDDDDSDGGAQQVIDSECEHSDCHRVKCQMNGMHLTEKADDALSYLHSQRFEPTMS